jgi:hypothetical protein
MLALTLSPDLVTEIHVKAARLNRLTDEQPLDLARLRDETADLQALIAEATSLERRALGQRRRPRRAARPVFFADEAAEEVPEGADVV